MCVSNALKNDKMHGNQRLLPCIGVFENRFQRLFENAGYSYPYRMYIGDIDYLV